MQWFSIVDIIGSTQGILTYLGDDDFLLKSDKVDCSHTHVLGLGVF